MVGAGINAFDEERRITFTGLTNNVNILDYSSDPTAQDNTNPQEGVITTNILGHNYTDLWLDKIKVKGSYVFTKRKNVGVVDRFRDFVTTDKSDKFYRDNLIRTKTGIFLPSRGLEKMPMSEEILLKHS